MVLYYGLLALQTANTVHTSAPSKCRSLHKKLIITPHAVEQSLPSSNSWIYTKDLQKHFDERYASVQAHLSEKISAHNQSTATLPAQRYDGDNAWMYSRSVRDYISHSTSKTSSPACSLSNQVLTRDRLPTKSPSKFGFFRRSTSSKGRLIDSGSQTVSVSKSKSRRSDTVIEEEESNDDHSGSSVKQRSFASHTI